MKIGVPKETAERERRVALVPDVVRRLVAAEHEVVIEAGAGLDRRRRGRRLHGGGCRRWATRGAPRWSPRSRRRPPRRSARLRPRHDPRRLPEPARRSRRAGGDRGDRRDGAGDGEDPAHLARAVDGRAVVAGDGLRLPRGADRRRPSSPRFFPMFMTAAGTVPPAQVLVLGAGVAGLQAIATARRLGAVVTGVRHPLAPSRSRSSRWARSSSRSRGSATPRPRAATRAS